MTSAALAKATRGPAALLLAITTVGLTAGCGDDPGNAPAASATAVSLSVEDAPAPLTVGVVVSLAAPPGEGAEWAGPAEGVRVAAYRYSLGGVRVSVRTLDDHGTAAGARSAVRRLVADHVAGIVLATEGHHVADALSQAQDSGTPVVLPYDAAPPDLAATAWTTGPDLAQVGTAVGAALAKRDLDRTLLVDAGGGALPGLRPAARVSYRPGDDPSRLADIVGHRTRNDDIDAVLVSGPAQLEAQVVATLEGLTRPLPIVLTPAALTPAFSAAVLDAGGTLDADLTTVGTAGVDTTTLDPTAAGRSAAGFFAALRSAAAEPHLADLVDGRPFAEVAADADARSHDAVVALVTAAARAGSADPRKVRDALAALRLTADDGLAGPALDFRDHAAVASDDVVPLAASTEDPGAGPATDARRIHWFAISNGS